MPKVQDFKRMNFAFIFLCKAMIQDGQLSLPWHELDIEIIISIGFLRFGKIKYK